MRKEKPRRRRGFFFCEKPGRGGRKPGLSQRIKADCGPPMKTLGGVRQWPADNKFNSRLDWMFLACGAPFRYLRRERRSIIAWQACLSKGSPSRTHRPRPILPRRHRERRVIGVLVIRYLIRDGRGAGQQAVKPRAKNDVGYGPGSPTIAVCKRVNPVQAPKNVCA
jgi:hypothetical protein